MTPVIFVSFLASLAWVEFRYSLMRSHSHSETPSSLPKWLHHVVYREAPYRYVRVDATGETTGGSPTTPRTSSSGKSNGSGGASSNASASASASEGSRWYYHSKQRKLMKMEVDDAFQIRGTVLMALGLLALVLTWAGCQAAWWLWTTVALRFA